jgi:hypothetical protein
VADAHQAARGGDAKERRIDFKAALKDAVLAALLAFGLFGLIVGIRTETGPVGALDLFPRPALLAAIVAIVFAGRFVVAILYQRGALDVDPARFVSAETRERLGRLSR